MAAPARPPHIFKFPSRLLELLRSDCKYRSPRECHEIGAAFLGLKPPYGTFASDRWLRVCLSKLPPDIPKPGESLLSRFMRFSKLYPKYDASNFDGLKWETIHHLMKIRDAEERKAKLDRINTKGEQPTREFRREVFAKTGFPPLRGRQKPRQKPPRDPVCGLRELRRLLGRAQDHSSAFLNTSGKKAALPPRVKKKLVKVLPEGDVRAFQNALQEFSFAAGRLFETVKKFEKQDSQ